MGWLERWRTRGAQQTPRSGHTVVAAPAGRARRLAPGTEIADTYAILRMIGEGAMGAVYLARHAQWADDVALKIPHAAVAADERERIVREAKVWTELGLHPNVTYCYYVHAVDDALVLVIEYVDGGNLREWIADRRCADLKLALGLALQCCHALEHAHRRRLIHRDVKPENILLTQEGVLKITDFGIVRAAGTPSPASSMPSVAAGYAGGTLAPGATLGWGVGTPGYMPPEQWLGSRPVDERSDIFGLGVCLYEMLCGDQPYDSRADREWQQWALDASQEPRDPRAARVESALPERLCRLMQQCVAWDRDRRPANVADVRRELNAIVEEQFHERSQWAELPPIHAQADGLNNQALSHLALSNAEDARRSWQSALAMEPHHPEATYNLSLHMWRGAELTDQQVLGKLGEVRASHATSWLPAWLTAEIHLERDDCEAARTTLAAIDEAVGVPEVQRSHDAAEKRLPNSTRMLVALREHTQCDAGVAVSGDGRVAISTDWIDRFTVWDPRTGERSRVVEGRVSEGSQRCESLSLSHDGRTALTGGSDRLLRFWDVASGRVVRTLEGHTGSVSSVVLSPDGRLAFSGSWDGTLKLWDVASGRCTRTLEGHGRASAVAMTADGRRAVSADWDGMKLWDLSSGHRVHDFGSQSKFNESAVLSADGRHALSSGMEGLRFWDVATGRCLRLIAGSLMRRGSSGGAPAVALSPDARLALAGPTLWDLTSGRCLRTFGAVWVIGWSADGRTAYFRADGHHLQIWNVNLQQPAHVARFRPCFVRSGAALAAGSDYERAMGEAREALATGDTLQTLGALRRARSQPGFARAAEALDLWAQLYRRLPRRSLAGVWETHVLKASSGVLSHDGRLVFLGNDGRLAVWDIAAGAEQGAFGEQAAAERPMCLSSDNRLGLSGSDDGRITIWDVETRRRIRVLEGHGERVMQARFACGERLVFSSSLNGTLKTWNAATGRCLRSTRDKSWTGGASLSPDGRFALTISDDTVRLWDFVRFRQRTSFKGHIKSAFDARFSADGRFAVSGGRDGTMKLWSLPNGRCMMTFGHADSVLSACLSIDGRFALAASVNGSLTAWKVATGERLRTVTAHGSGARHVSLSADGRRAMSFGDDELKLWFLDWELEERPTADWDDGARAYLDVFAAARRCGAGDLPSGDPLPAPEAVEQALAGSAPPAALSDVELARLLDLLACAGYGWLNPEGVRREFERAAT